MTKHLLLLHVLKLLDSSLPKLHSKTLLSIKWISSQRFFMEILDKKDFSNSLLDFKTKTFLIVSIV